MGVFRNFPYSNFHEMNLDEIIKIMRELEDEWTATKAEWKSYKDFIDNYFENLDVTAEVLNAMRIFANDGTLNTIMSPTIANEVTKWLNAHITTPESVVIDNTLAVSGACADAFVTGNIKRGVKGYYNEIEYTLVNGEYVDRTDGHFAFDANWSRTNWIEIDPSKIYYFYGVNGTFNGWYDKNHNFINAFTLSAGLNTLIPANNVKYMVISKRTNDFPIQIFTSEYNEWHTGFNKIINEDNIIPFKNWKCGIINEDGTIGLSGTRLYSEPVECIGGTSYDLEVNIVDGLIMLITEYDANDNFVYQTNYLTYSRGYIPNPATRKLRFMIGTDPARSLNPEDGMKLGYKMTLTEVPKYLKVMTYNVGHYNYGTSFGIPDDIYDEKLTNYRRFFGNQKIELVGFQEYDSRMDVANTIWATDALWNHYFEFERHTGSQSAVMSTKYLSYTDNKKLSTGRYYTEGYILDNIYVMSVHLSVGVNNAETRITEANEIINIASQHNKFIIFGDFNAEPGEEDSLFALFKNAGMNLANCDWFGKYYTWSSNREDFDHYDKPTGTLYYIDNIITSSNITIYDAQPIPEAYNMLTSDHIPLVATLKLK